MVRAVVEDGVDERAGAEQVGVAARAERGRPVLTQLEASTVVRAELLEAGGVAAEVPGEQREAFGDLREIRLEGDGVQAHRPVDAAAVIAGSGPDPVGAIERVADLPAGAGEAAELARPERLAGGERLDH